TSCLWIRFDHCPARARPGWARTAFSGRVRPGGAFLRVERLGPPGCGHAALHPAPLLRCRLPGVVVAPALCFRSAAPPPGPSSFPASEEHLKQHYVDLKDRPFFPGLVKYMNSGPVVAMVWEGLNVVKTGRVMLGETNPADSKPGTIRGDFCIQVGRNIIHGSDSVKSAEKEISLWFKPEELVDYKSCAHDWVYE
uniref:Nucleoside diphosphate kinase n=1 Tax=Piliocolobus tephrosceles TaxID=591936 RepID=A0A8C9IZV9_9PRIM